MKTVELRQAYSWVCDCLTMNFAQPMLAEFGPGEKEEAYRKYHDMEPWQVLPDDWEQFNMVHIPTVVECQNCGAKFKAVDERSEEPIE